MLQNSQIQNHAIHVASNFDQQGSYYNPQAFSPYHKPPQNVSPLQNWGHKRNERKFGLNIDNELVKLNYCKYRGYDNPNSAIVPVPKQAHRPYVLPGGVLSAIKFYPSCGL
jgi:hypothetical protein